MTGQESLSAALREEATNARRCPHGYLWIGGLYSYCPWCGPKKDS